VISNPFSPIRGADPEVAVVPARAADMMIEYDQRVRHFEIVD
jgi:hypothetical protein